MTAQIRRRGRHSAGYKHRGTAAMVRGAAVWLLALAALFAVGAIAQPVPSQAGTVTHAVSP